MVDTRFDGLALGQQAGVTRFPGLPKYGLLRVAANVAGGETITIGPDTYRIAIVNTDSGKNTSGGQFNNVKPELHGVTMTSHGLVVRDLIRVENEIMEVIGVPSPHRLHLRRGVSGTTIATHADGLDIFTEATPGGAGIAVGLVATLTPTAFVTAFVPDVNNRGSASVKAKAMGAAGPVLVVATDKRNGSYVLGNDAPSYSTTETLAGAGNAWDSATLGGGVDPHTLLVVKLVPTAAQVTEGKIYVPTPFESPVVVESSVYVTATRAAKAWDGAITTDGQVVVLDNTGATDWATTDSIVLFIRE